MFYYGFRYYDPELGRWPNRDPLGEFGSPNLFSMINNQVPNRFDYLGMLVYKEGCGCVEESFKCCTAAQKSQYNQELYSALSQANSAYVTAFDAITDFFNSFRRELASERDNQVRIADRALAWELDACDSYWSGWDPLNTSMRLACKFGANTVHGAAVSAIWAAYGSGIALANGEEVTQKGILTAILKKEESRVQKERDSKCDNW